MQREPAPTIECQIAALFSSEAPRGLCHKQDSLVVLYEVTRNKLGPPLCDDELAVLELRPPHGRSYPRKAAGDK